MGSHYVSLLALNTARLLLIPDYICTQHYLLAGDMIKELTASETLDKNQIEGLFHKAHQLVARDANGKRAIMTVRNDLEYLFLLRE